MTNLTEMQKTIVTTKAPKVLVLSSAASGKSMVIVERIRYLLNNGVNPSEIVAITFTNNAASVMYERLNNPVGLFIGTVHSYCNYLLRGNAVDTTKIIQEERFDDLFEEIKSNPTCIKHVKYLIVDEAQDSTQQQFEFFELINPDNFMYVGDVKQSIYGFNGADPQYLIEKENDKDTTVYHMSQNFRNYSDILSFGKRFLYRLGPDYNDDSVSMRYECDKHVIEGSVSPIVAAKSLKMYKEATHTNYSDWFVLCRTNIDVELFMKLLQDELVPVDTFKQADLTNSEIEKKMKENTVKVLTVHSAKGLENKCVMAYNIRAYNDEEARLCYVAATRARDLLVWFKMPPKNRRKKRDIVSWE